MLINSFAQRVLITGAGGFVGYWLRRALLAALPADCRVLSTSTGAEEVTISDPRESFAELDIRDESAVETVVKVFSPTTVIHLAAISDVKEAERARRATWDVNLFGTMNLAYAVLRFSPGARFIFVSSSEVYGSSFKGDDRPIDENSRLAPKNSYATSKAAADLFVGQVAGEGLRVIRFRPFNHTGPRQSTRFAIPAFAAQVARIKRGLQDPVIRVGNLAPQRDFLDVRDVVEAYVRAVMLPEGGISHNAILNLASGIPRRIGDILQELMTIGNITSHIEEDVERIRSNDTPVAIGNAALAKTALDWSPQIPWATTLHDLFSDALARLDDHSSD
jgi:GDP-4-dehydro-6-deoxy-D-mannose reductase